MMRAARAAGGLHDCIEHRRGRQGAALAGDSKGGAAVARMTSRPAPHLVDVRCTMSSPDTATGTNVPRGHKTQRHTIGRDWQSAVPVDPI